MLVLIIEKEVFCQTFVHKSLSSPEWNSGRLSQKAKAFSSGVFSGVWTSFTREKRFKSRLFVRSELKNYPVDDFWRLSLELVHLWCKDESFYFICSGLHRRTDVRQHRNSIQPLSIFLFLYWFGVFRLLRKATKGFASGHHELFSKSSIKNFCFGQKFYFRGRENHAGIYHHLWQGRG